MYTKEELAAQIRAAGIRNGDTVMLHTSMRAVGPVEGGADTLIDAFRDVLADGLLVIPTHTWHTVPRTEPVFDVRSSVPCTGIVSEIAAFRKDGVRSLHPTHSVAAFGKDARSFVDGELNASSPADPAGITGKLLARNAKMFLLGVGHDRNTMIHGIEEMIDVPDRLTADFCDIPVIDENGIEHMTHVRRHACPISVYYPKFEPIFVHFGLQKEYPVGNAVAKVCESREICRLLHYIEGRTDQNLCRDDAPVDERLWKDYDRQNFA